MKTETALGLFLFACYLFFLPLSVTLEDSGEMLMVASSFGIAHQPGYPIMGLLGGLFAKLPTGNVALNVHLMSSLFGVLTLILAYRVILTWTGDAMAATFGAVVAAVAPTVLWYFTVAEVYSQFTFFYFCCLCVILREKSTPWLFLLIGLGLLAHPALFVFASPALLILRPQIFREINVKAIALLLLGLCPYLYFFYRGQGGDYLAMGQVNGISDWLKLVGMTQMGVETRFSSWDQWMHFKHAGLLLFRDYAGIGVVLALIGLYSLYCRRQFRVIFALLWLILGMNVALQFVQHLKFDILFAEQVEQFLVLPVLAMGLAAAIGAAWLFKRRPFAMRLVIFTLLALTSILVNWRHYEIRPQNTFAREIATTYLRAMPPDTVLLLHGDSDVGPITYVNRIEGVRKDVKLVSQNGFLVRPPGVEDRGDYSQKLAGYIQSVMSQGGRAAAIRLTPQVRGMIQAMNLEIRDYGLFSEIAAANNFAGLMPDTLATVTAFADRFASGEIKSKHWAYYAEAILGPICRYLIMQKVSHPILDSSVYCRYYNLLNASSSEETAAKAKKLWAEAQNFPDDEKASIQELVDRHRVSY